MSHFAVLLLGFAVDLFLGDPRWLPHPVQGIGWLISVLESGLRKLFPKTERGELLAGSVLVVCVVGLTGLSTGLALSIAATLHPALQTVVSAVL